MERRSFVGALAAGSAAMAQAQVPASRTRVYCMDFLYYRQGDQAARLNQFLSGQSALFLKHAKVYGVFTAVMAPRTQTMLVLSGWEGVAEMYAGMAKIESDAAHQKAHAELDSGAEPAYDSAQRVLLGAKDYSPEIVMPKEKPKAPRYFELRVYHAPTARQLKLVHERFTGGEIDIFHRSGVNPILYADTIAGPDMPNLTYLMPFASLADREKAWDKFGADPDWVKLRGESIAKGGQIVNYNNISLWRATAYSPIQ